MFEIFVTACLAPDRAACRDQLVPVAALPDRAACEARLDAAPEGAFCAPAGPQLAVAEVAPGVFVHQGRIEEPDAANRADVANLGFVIGESSVAVIDAGAARWIAEAAWRAIRARTDLPVRHLVLTHMHPDHVHGAGFFAEAGAEVVGHEGLDRALADRAPNYAESFERLLGAAFAGSGIAATDIAVTGRVEIDLGGRTLELRAWPVAHTGTDLTARDTATGLLFAGDLVFDAHTPALDGSVRGWQAVLAELAAEPLAGVVPGHGAALLAWPDGAEATRRYLEVLERDARAALAAGLRLGEATATVAASERNAWQLFDAYNPRNATVAFTELEWE